MNNKFYNAFDLERFPNTETGSKEYRDAFQIERDRIIFSYPFRRLQSKTQVFQSGEYDFYRTRLTHSIEVAKISRSVCEYLRATSKHLSEDFYISADLTEAVGLAHDMGHPPFGHAGERKLNELMSPYGGFESNAQTLRILTELIYERTGSTKGIAPTHAFLDGIMKYKALHEECIITKDSISRIYPENHFIYDQQVTYREFIFGEEASPAQMNNSAALNAFKSIECQIMDWADDTAYSLNDIVDGIHARYINTSSLNLWAADQALDSAQSEQIEHLCKVIREERYEPYFGGRIGDYVHSCALSQRSGFLSDRTWRHAFDLNIEPSIKKESELYKKIALDLIFRSPQIQQIEFKGGHILSQIFNSLAMHCTESPNNGLKILPTPVQCLIDKEADIQGRYRRLCDYIAGLTDSLAVRTYKRLFDPEFGSIAELL